MLLSETRLGIANKQDVKQQQQLSKTLIKISFLQNYISSTFSGCGLPPLNEFLSLKIQQEEISLKLQNINKYLNEQSSDYIYYLYCGKVFLKKNNDIQDTAEEKSNRRNPTISSVSRTQKNFKKGDRLYQVKENSFFTLLNYKKILEPTPQRYSIEKFEVSDTNRKCLIARIKIKPNFNEDWYKHETEKFSFLSKVFYREKNEISEYKMKGLSRFFKHETFRRGTSIVREDEANEKLLIMKNGECQFMKNLYYQQNNYVKQKQMKLANGGSSTVLGCEFVLFDFFGSSKQVGIALKGLNIEENTLTKIKISDESVHNFTVLVNSAFAEFYYMDMNKFKELCEKYVHQAPSNIRNNIQNGYITLLRTLKQKMTLQTIKLQRNQKKVHEDRELFEARLQSGQYQMDKIKEESDDGGFYRSQTQLQVKKSDLETNNMKQGLIEDKRTKNIQKKIDIILQTNKSDINYKKKIQNLLRQKIKKKMELEQENQIPERVGKSKKIVDDLQQIFMNDDNGRTQSIQRQNQILKRKELLLKKRYNSTDNILIVHEECYDKKKNKLFKMDLLKKGIVDKDLKVASKTYQKSLDMKAYSSQIKNRYAQKINKANKIKEQFMKIRSECENCHCYDNIQTLNQHSGHRDIKNQTMKTGSAWRVSESRASPVEEPLEKLHFKTKFLSQKAVSKYEHNKHLQMKRKNYPTSSRRRLSAPLIL